jgi:flavin-dependent dehydrogenase
LIVGGGPAGLATAIALRMQGADVLVADALKPPIDKACGEGLMPDAGRDLAGLGIHCEPTDGAPFRGIRFVDCGHGEPIAASADFAGTEGIGVRRTVLHARMVERAVEIGVRLRWNTHVALERAVSLDQKICHYGFLVGADGQSSRVRKWAGLEPCRLISRRFGFRRHYRIAPLSNFVEVYWCDLGQIYITPVGPDEICVAVVTRFSSIRMQHVIHAVSPLRERLSPEASLTVERGALTTSRRLLCVARDNIALVGDASGSVDAVTGEGLAISFRQANLLSRSLQKGSFELYSAGHEKTLKVPRRMAFVLLMMDRHRSMRRIAMRTLAGAPDIFRGLLRVHVGEESLPRFLVQGSAAMMRLLANSGISGSDTESVAT